MSGDLSVQTVRSIAWSTAAFLSGRAVTFLALLVITRLLPPADFGVVAAVVVFLSLLELGSDLGMRATVIYEQERGVSDRIHVAFTLNLLVAGALVVIGVAAAPLIAAFFDMSEHTSLFRLAALNPLISGLANVHDGILMRDLAFRRRMVPALARALARGTTMIALAASGAGPASLVAGMLAGSVVWTTTQWILAPFRPRLLFDRRIAREMASYGMGAAAVQVVAVIGTRADQAVIGRVLDERALGLYTIAYRLPEMLIGSITWNVSDVAFPALSQKRARDGESLARPTLKLLRHQALLTLPISAGLAAIATPLTVLLFSDAWREAGSVMAAIAVMSGIGALTFPLGDVFKALGKQRTYVVLMAVHLPVLVALMIAAAPYGILAVAWGRAALSLFHLVLVTAVVARAVRMSATELARAVGPGLACAAGVWAGAAGTSAGLGAGATEAAVVVLASLAGVLAGALALRVLAGGAWRELRSSLPALARRVRTAP